MADMRVNIDPSAETTGLSQVGDAQVAENFEGQEAVPAPDGYSTGEVLEAPKFDTNFAQGAKRFAENATLPERPRNRIVKAEHEAKEAPRNEDAYRQNAYAMPVPESCRQAIHGWGDRRESESERAERCEVEAADQKLATEMFKRGNDLDERMDAAIKHFQNARTPDEIRLARREIYDVAEDTDVFLKDLHSDAVMHEAYTYSKEYDQMFFGIGNSKTQLRQLLKKQGE